MMDQLVKVFFGLFFLIAFTGCEHTVLKGEIRYTGTDYFGALVIVTEKGKVYELTGELVPKIRENYQSMILTLEGVIHSENDHPLIPAKFEVIKILDAPEF